MKKLLVVVDMQNDFVTGALGSERAREIAPLIAGKIRAYDGEVACTMDTHGEDYLSTREGRYLPVSHCVRGTEGWKLCGEVENAVSEHGAVKMFEKDTFASDALAEYIRAGHFDEIELVGVCTDICVVSNALAIRTAAENARIIVDGTCCAGVTEDKHRSALDVMQSCQIEII